MLTISKEANPNYLCKLFKIHELRKHSNADKLQILSIDFQDVITGLEAKEGDVYVYFPVECKINKDFLSYTNCFRDIELNKDKEESGFFESNCRVKAVRLRGEKSCGYVVPVNEVIKWAYGFGIHEDFTFKDLISENINKEFDTINGQKLLEKYVINAKKSNSNNKQGKKPQLSRLIDNQVHLHVNTENLRRNSYKINPEDTISITYKTHGTSWWASNILVKRKLTILEKFLMKFGIKLQDKEYDIVYGSRRVVKNKSFKDPKGKDHYYGYDLWKSIKDSIEGDIPKGISLYGECLGYTNEGSYIQGPYDYGCKEGEFKLEVYRITYTNEDGIVTEFSYSQIVEICKKLGLTPSHLFYYGKANDYHSIKNISAKEENRIEKWQEQFINRLEKEYLEKDCFMCNNKVPAEGIVIRKEKLFSCEPYKLKSFRFLEAESKQLDSGEINIEDNN